MVMQLKWLFLVVMGMVITVLNVLAAPLIALFIRDGQLPVWISWFQTADNPACGDQAFQDNQIPWTKSLPRWLGQYVLGIGWAIRNPGYGYDHWAGVEIQICFEYSSSGDESVNIGRTPDGVCHVTEGVVKRHLFNGDGKEYFQYTRLQRWWFYPDRAWRISFGWCLYAEGMKVVQRRNLAFTINPWMDCRDGSV